MINITKAGEQEVSAPLFSGVEFPQGVSVPQDVLELTFNANTWKSADGRSWNNSIGIAAPAGTKITVSKEMIDNHYIVYGYKGPNSR